MSQPYFSIPSEVSCPYCKVEGCYVEDLGGHPFFLSGDCGECGKDFSYDCGSSEYYDEKGNKIKEA